MYNRNKFTKIISERGSAILIAMALIAMLTGVAIMSVNRSSTDIDLSYNQLHSEQAFYLAESGISRALIDINADNSWRDGYYRNVLKDGHYTVTLVDSVTRPALYDSVVMTSEGYYHEGTCYIESWLVPEYIHPFQYGMFAGQGINFDKFGCVDSYNSDSGTYAVTVDSTNGSIGSNGTITTSQNVTIGGDANTATGGSIILGPGSQVMGDTSTTLDSVNLDIIPQSEYDWARSVSNTPGGISGLGYTYNNGSRALTTSQNATVVLQSGVYYFSSISLAQNSTITVAPGADVVVYITGDFNLGQYSTVNALGNPSDFQVYSQGDLNFNQYNIFYGTFYGPNSDIQYDQTSEVYGALVGNSIQLDQGACFHYDRNLGNLTKGTTGKMVSVAWRVLQ